MAPVRLLAIVLATFALDCAAAPFAVQVGDARLGLDAPAGFSDTGFTGSPRLQEMAEALTSASNRILLFALTDADLRRFMGGDTPEFKRYVLAVTPRGMERERLRRETFGAFVGESLRELGGAAPPAPDYRKYLDASQGRVALIAELRRDPEVVSVLQGARLPSPPRASVFADPPAPQYVLSTTTLLLLHGKALSLSVFSPYESPADLEWIRAVTLRWLEDLQRLNSR